MFTGIIEAIGTIINLENEGDSLHVEIACDFAAELKIDQSVSHNGVCLTVTACDAHSYRITAIKETLNKSNLNSLKLGDPVNLERGMKLGERLDGHIVQGHIDQTATCTGIAEQSGSWIFSFEYDPELENITIEKGSITVNGVSLTVLNSQKSSFSVAIIPYTYQHTLFNTLKIGDTVNLEFDVIGKYVKRLYGAGS